MLTTKLLANADWWADRGVYNRDVIDLAMMEPPHGLLDEAIAKAAVPYGRSVRDSLDNVIAYLRDNPHRLDECQAALKVQGVPKATLWQRIKGLRA
jgi:hypothetical protein